MMNFALQNIFVHTCKWFFTCRKILRGISDFTSLPKQGVLRILISIKNPSPQLGLNSLTLGSMGPLH
jgi:hypothetical protein